MGRKRKGVRVSIVCRNYTDDRVLPRFARYLAQRLGWQLTRTPDVKADVLYLLGYFEGQGLARKWPDRTVAAYFTHREEEPPGNAKAQLFDAVGRRVDLRVAMCRKYGEELGRYGPTIQPPLPVERERFVPVKQAAHKRPVVGLSGYTYPNRRKGDDLVRGMLKSKVAQRVEWRASGRGWPVPTQRYNWREMPGFYQGLDVLVCPSRVEGGPMPVLEALSCGVPVVVPRGVGLIDELPDVAGIYRYERGDVNGLAQALERAAFAEADVDHEALRAATEPYTVEAFCEEHARAFEGGMSMELDAGIEVAEEAAIDPQSTAGEQEPPVAEEGGPVEMKTGTARGIYCVAFGEPSRKCAQRLIRSVQKHMPDIPIALCAAKPIGGEKVFIEQPDSDIGGRRAKLKAYELAPAEWKAVLYLDADTEVVAPIYRYFEWIEDGWELVITKDPHLMDTMHSFKRRNNAEEYEKVQKAVHTMHTLQYNGGVWAFGRGPRIQAFFRRWQREWEKYAQRDQGALIRAMYADPLRVLVLGNEWNTFPKYTRGITTAGLMHYPGDARRWAGMVPGRIDSPAAWAMVKQFERTHKRK